MVVRPSNVLGSSSGYFKVIVWIVVGLLLGYLGVFLGSHFGIVYETVELIMIKMER